jgi:hypothetical protein
VTLNSTICDLRIHTESSDAYTFIFDAEMSCTSMSVNMEAILSNKKVKLKRL